MSDDDNDKRQRRPRRRAGRWVLFGLPVVFVVGALLLAIFGDVGQDGLLRLVYLGLLLVFLYGFWWVEARANLGRTLRYGLVWVAIGGVLFVGYSFRDEFAWIADRIKADHVTGHGFDTTENQISFRAGPGGHYLVHARVDGVTIEFLVDTGASDVVLSPADARKLGYDTAELDYRTPYRTANGIGYGAPVRLDTVAVGPAVIHDVRASVNQAEMNVSLLGMTFLEEIGGYQVRNGVLTLYAE